MIKKIGNKIKAFIFNIYSNEKKARILGVKMGQNNFIASRFWSTEPYLIEIGSNCAITSGVKMFTHGGARVARSVKPKFDYFGKIVIGNNIYIGNNVLIMPGVTIGDNVLIAAGSVVTKSVPSNVVIGGNPAKILCTVEQYIQNNIPYNLDSKDLSNADKKTLLLSLDDSKFIKKAEMKF